MNQQNDYKKKLELRKQKFKKTIDFDAVKDKRVQIGSTLSKNKKEDFMLEKRMKKKQGKQETVSKINFQSEEFQKQLEKKIRLIPIYSKLIFGTDLKKRLENLGKIRKLLSIPENPPFEQVIQTGIIKELITIIDNSNEDIQFEIVWIICNISSGTIQQTQYLIDNNIENLLIKYLKSPNKKIRKLCSLALNNIYIDFQRHSSKQEVLKTLLEIFPTIKPHSLEFHTFVLLTSSLIRGKSLVNSDQASQILSLLVNNLKQNYKELKRDILWCLLDLIRNENMNKDLIQKSGLHLKLMNIITKLQQKIDVNPREKIGYEIIIICLNQISIIFSMDEGISDEIMELKNLEPFKNILVWKRRKATEGIIKILSNSSLNENSIQKYLDGKILINLLELEMDSSNEIRILIFSFLIKMIKNANSNQMSEIFSTNFFKKITSLIEIDNTESILTILNLIEEILKKENSVKNSPMIERMEEANLIEKIEQLQTHPNEEIYQKTFSILETFFA
ncbi:importin alpha [Anaeramoeba ignava]|uniref:Importin alpha n=1 Tax=Anaeramoeba ignava TaxID=1746090 RepID=A0A9Q0R6M0_ANAIG|nr:importin alpha [Anaeramoeba ignava]